MAATFDDFIAAISEEQLATNVGAVKLSDADELLRDLKQVFSSPGVALVLGAGVSSAGGVPAWSKLLSNLVIKTLTESAGVQHEGAKVLADVYGPTLPTSNLVQARFLKRTLGEHFVEAVRAAIYEEMRKPKDVPLLVSLAKVCQCRESVPGGVKEIITYNFDRLFEDSLEEFGRAFTVIDRGTFPKKSDLPIRHVHGYLGKTRVDGEWIVFSEDEYHEQYSDPFAWSNVIQLNAFSQRSCVFVGLSLDDPNMRRLLEAVRRTKGVEFPHFAFLRRTSASDVEEAVAFGWRNAGQPSGENKAKVKERISWLSQLADETKESVLSDLGVRVIWYGQHKELPSLIDRLRE